MGLEVPFGTQSLQINRLNEHSLLNQIHQRRTRWMPVSPATSRRGNGRRRKMHSRLHAFHHCLLCESWNRQKSKTALRLASINSRDSYISHRQKPHLPERRLYWPGRTRLTQIPQRRSHPHKHGPLDVTHENWHFWTQDLRNRQKVVWIILRYANGTVVQLHGCRTSKRVRVKASGQLCPEPGSL